MISSRDAHLNGSQVTIIYEDDSNTLLTQLQGAILDVYMELDKQPLKASRTASEVLKMLLRDYYYMKYEEFMLVFRMMKEGKFGSFYGKLGLAEFQRSFKEYDTSEERSLMWENLHKSKKIDTLPEITAEMYDEAIERMKQEANEKVSSEDANALYKKLKAEYSNVKSDKNPI
jgi:hypothetical protein